VEKSAFRQREPLQQDELVPQESLMQAERAPQVLQPEARPPVLRQSEGPWAGVVRAGSQQLLSSA